MIVAEMATLQTLLHRFYDPGSNEFEFLDGHVKEFFIFTRTSLCTTLYFTVVACVHKGYWCDSWSLQKYGAMTRRAREIYLVYVLYCIL
jgi:hypothetical protein